MNAGGGLVMDASRAALTGHQNHARSLLKIIWRAPPRDALIQEVRGGSGIFTQPAPSGRPALDLPSRITSPQGCRAAWAGDAQGWEARVCAGQDEKCRGLRWKEDASKSRAGTSRPWSGPVLQGAVHCLSPAPAWELPEVRRLAAIPTPLQPTSAPFWATHQLL